MSRRLLAGILFTMIAAPTLFAQRGGGLDLNTPRPIAALDSVWIEELTWMEVRDALKAGKTTAIIAAGSTEQNGPYVPTAKHAYILRATADAVARKLGNALVAPIVMFEPGRVERATTPGTLTVRQEIYEGLIADMAASLKQNGFKNILLIGDSGGNQPGLATVAKKLSSEWPAGSARILHIPEYYDSWKNADAIWMSERKQRDGIHDDYSVNSIIMTVDPEKIRFEQRVAANKATIDGFSLLPAQKTVDLGKKMVDIRANITVEAVKKALAQ
jgi:creatinine amidohydrolase